MKDLIQGLHLNVLPQNFQVVPIHVFADAEDYLLLYEACPRIASIRAQIVGSAAFEAQVKNNSDPIITKMSEAAKRNLTVNEAYAYADQLAARYFCLLYTSDAADE